MWKINTLLNEIQARAHRANLDHDCILRRNARVKQRETDIPRLVAALREAVAALDRCPCDHAETLERVEAALRGEK